MLGIMEKASIYPYSSLEFSKGHINTGFFADANIMTILASLVVTRRVGFVNLRIPTATSPYESADGWTYIESQSFAKCFSSKILPEVGSLTSIPVERKISLNFTD